MNPDFNALGEATRRLILGLIANAEELCVCELAASLEEVQPSISRHLSILREAGWLKSRREGTWIFYRLDELPAWAELVITAILQGGIDSKIFETAWDRLHQFEGRPLRIKKACCI
jgi:ArsR family transcriptional regulator